MKIAVACSLSNSHMIFLDHFIKSVLRFNPTFNYDWLIFCRPTESIYAYSLSKQNKNRLKKLYPKIKFIPVDVEKYMRYDKEAVIYYSIELFNQKNYDKIIFFGADMICLKDMSGLFEFAKNVTGVAMPKEKRRPGCYNNGSMIVNKKYLNDKTYQELLRFEQNHPRYRDYYGHDQKIYNVYFKNKNIKEVPQKFGTLVSETGYLKKKNIVILHYFYKPTQTTGRIHLDNWMIKEWEQYDTIEDRYNSVTN